VKSYVIRLNYIAYFKLFIARGMHFCGFFIYFSSQDRNSYQGTKSAREAPHHPSNQVGLNC
jgi:hypothetical protein